MRTVGEEVEQGTLYLCCTSDPVANTYVMRWVLAPEPQAAKKAFQRAHAYHIPAWRTVAVLAFEHIPLTCAMKLGSEVHYRVSEEGSGLVSCDETAVSLHAHFQAEEFPRARD